MQRSCCYKFVLNFFFSGCWKCKKTKPFSLKTNVPTQFTEPVTLKFKAALKRNYREKDAKGYKPYEKIIQVKFVLFSFYCLCFLM
jgi:hypothetical protein